MNGWKVGVYRWLKLTEGLGLDNDYVESTEGLLPATRFAVDAYVHFVAERTLATDTMSFAVEPSGITVYYQSLFWFVPAERS